MAGCGEEGQEEAITVWLERLEITNYRCFERVEMGRPILFIRDRDELGARDLERLVQKGVHVLDVREIENYLCQPAALRDLGREDEARRWLLAGYRLSPGDTHGHAVAWRLDPPRILDPPSHPLRRRPPAWALPHQPPG